MKAGVSIKGFWHVGVHYIYIFFSKWTKTPLNDIVVKNIVPIYVRLTNKWLIEKILSLGQTQYAKEVLDGLMWSKWSKITFKATWRVEADVGEYISVYNEGYLLAMIQLLEEAGLSLGSNIASHAKKRDFDHLCLRLCQARSSEKYNKYRKLLSSSTLKEEELKKARGGTTYRAGEF